MNQLHQPLPSRWSGEEGVINEFSLFHSLASNLQLTFTGFFHKAGESFPVCAFAFELFGQVLFFCCCVFFFQGNYLRTVRTSRTLCLWRFCWSKFVTRRGRCVGITAWLVGTFL